MKSPDATIMIVDDDAGIRVTLGGILEDAGYRVIGLGKGADALEMMRRNPFDVVITNIRLPDISGLKILKLAKETNPEAAVIIMTGFATVETAVEAVNRGAYAYFVKPVNPDEIKNTIANALKQQRLSLENKRLVESLQRSNEELRNDITERKRAEHDLKERVKELQCLYGIARIAARPVTLDEIYQKVVNLLPVSWQYPEITCARIITDGKEFKTQNYRETVWKQSSEIKIGGEKAGIVEVGYLEEKPEADEGPFLKEERMLIDTVSRHLGEITERKRAEEEIRKFKTIVDNTGNGIGIATLEGEFIYVNESYAQMHGYTIDEVIGKQYSIFYTKEQLEYVERLKARILQKGGYIAEEVWHKRKDGTVFLSLMTAMLVRDDKGKPLYTSAVVVDITERKRMEQKLQEKNEQLDAQNEELQSQAEELMVKTRELEVASNAKSEFMARMSHELRTPLNVIIGFSELMLDEVTGKVNEEQTQCLNDILGGSQHLLGLINDILDLSKIESGKMELRLRNIALPTVIESLRSEMMLMLARRKQSLEIDVAEELPPVRADKAKVKQVLINLLSNSAKFTPDGGKLRVEAVRENGWCRVSVIDNGIGIKKEDQERIFKSFYQLDNTLPRESGGTGLGLAIARQIIEKHGGQLWVESKYGEGSRFSFTLPLAAAD